MFREYRVSHRSYKSRVKVIYRSIEKHRENPTDEKSCFGTIVQCKRITIITYDF